MNCIVRHKDADMSFQMRCVAVESERVFGDMIVTQQTPRLIPRNIYPDDVPLIFGRRDRNQAHEILEAPDFMAMNRRRVFRHRRSVPVPESIEKRPMTVRRYKSMDEGQKQNVVPVNCNDNNEVQKLSGHTKQHKAYPAPLMGAGYKCQEVVVSSLVDQLLLDIYGLPGGERGRSESESTASSVRLPPQPDYLQRRRLVVKTIGELRILVETLSEHVNYAGGLLIRQLRRKDHLVAKRDKQYDVITAHLQALSEKRSEDTKMRFSVAPQPGESGFTQWLDAMKMVARLPGGIPSEFRKRLWLTLSERHLQQRGVDWRQAEKLCFNEWSNPDDEELGIQIVKDLHRTGCSLFCGAAGRDNQAVLRRVLLGFARWNKSVGYCQGLNVLAALVLQVMDRAEAAAVKVMIYLIEGVLPEGYFADNLRGLSVDMAVFRDLLRLRLPKLSRHLEALQSDVKDKATGSSYEPPLTNVFTMQWFLTLFCHCLPQEAVLRVWDLIFLEGDEVLLRTALAIWEGLADRIMTVSSADEFYSIMGVLTREMLEFTDTNNLVKAIVSTGPLTGVKALREKHRYNITPWVRRLSDDDETETEEDERLAVAAAMFGMSQRGKKDRESSSSSSLQTVAATNDRERLALDISTLKQQYAKLRERQRQAHIILSAACARQSLVPSATSHAMNHLLVGKSALVSTKIRQLGPPPGAVPPKTRLGPPHSPRNPSRKDKQEVTLHWKDTKRRKESKDDVLQGEETSCNLAVTSAAGGMSVARSTSPRPSASASASASANVDSDSDSTSTELCDEPDRLSDVDSEEPTSTSDCYVMATDDEKSPRRESPIRTQDDERKSSLRESRMVPSRPEQETRTTDCEETSIAEITDQIRRLSAHNEGTVSCEVGNESSDGFQRGSVFEVKDVEASVNRTNEEVKNPSELLDSFDFSICTTSSSRGESNCESIKDDVKVPLHGEYQLSEDSPLTLQISRSDSRSRLEPRDDLMKPNEKLFATDFGGQIDRVDTQSVSEITPDLASAGFDKKLDNLDSRVKNFRTELDFGSDASVIGNVPPVAMSSENSNKVVAELKPYSRSYVIGHLPISPINLEQKLNYSAESPSSTVPINMAVMETQEFRSTIRKSQNKSNGVTVNISNMEFDESMELPRNDTVKRQVSSSRLHLESIQSPKTPGSDKSSGSGETMGPDSKTSSLTVSPRTPLGFESRDFHADKSVGSSVSSESKTLTLHSVGSDDQDAQSKTETKITSYTKSSSPSLISFDSFKSKSNLSPKLEASSSSDSCSPERKKSSERSFSSDLQSPISANSIKFTSNCKGGRGTFSDSPVNVCSATSPFYPIARPNEKTPSPYHSITKQRSSATDSAETSPEQKSTSSSKGSTKLTIFESTEDQAVGNDEGAGVELSKSTGEDFRYSFGKDRTQKTDLDSSLLTHRRKTEEGDAAGFYGMDYSKSYRMGSQLKKNELGDQYADEDTVSPLPREKLEKLAIFHDKNRSLLDRTRELEISRDFTKPFERSSSSLDKRFIDPKVSSSADEFRKTSCLKKRSSDILEDLRHIEVKTSGDGRSENGQLTKKTSDILEDLKSLEARRQDTFSDSASSFSKVRLGDSDVNICSAPRKQYVIEPKIQIQEDSESFLNTLARASESSDGSDDKEPKLGVWTKVKPRKKSDNGRRSSDRALKIIQENSAILHRILTCQAKKRLPDLEEISKEITISPINEEISKIFSPILEKIGLNEHEINEELARINFKDFDQLSVTSEFDAKINDELSKLSLIDDSEEIDHMDLDEALSKDYLDTREALIDRQINEELSKLLANYEERPSSSVGLPRQEKGSSSQNISELEGLDLSSISTNVFSHKSSNDSIETKSELGSIQEMVIKPEKLYDYNDKPISYPPPKYTLQDISPKSDIDIYRELEKLDKISAGEIYPSVQPTVAPEVTSAHPYSSDSLPYSEIISPIMSHPSKSEKPFDSSPLRSPYDTYKPYDFRSRISPRRTPSNPYSARSYEKPSIDSSFDFSEHKSIIPSSHVYDLSPIRPVLSKETLEFRVRYDDEPSQQIRGEDFNIRPFETDIADLNKGAAYYDTNTAEPRKYFPREESFGSDKEIGDSMDFKYNKSESYHRKYQEVSPEEYSYQQKSDYNRTSSYILPSPVREDDIQGTHLSVRRRESHSLSPSHQFVSRKLPVPVNAYITKLSPSLEDFSKRPVSHPEFLDKMNVSKYTDHSSQGSNNYRKSSLSLGNIGHSTKSTNRSLEKTPSPQSQFSPFPVRNTVRKPKELGLKLGLYSPTSPGSAAGQIKRTH